MKKLKFVKRSNGAHWVGDGFPVRNIFSYDDIAHEISPFLLLDYAGPREFPPTQKKLGVGEHPHRGFETVSIIYSGEVSHRDSSGGGGTIGPGEVQWMTAASGLVHEEFHGPNYARTGGPFEMVQLWVNLPAREKMREPRYQAITAGQIPEALLPEGAGRVRVIAGSCSGVQGPAMTFTPMEVWDVRLSSGKKARFEFKAGHTASFLVLTGQVRVPSSGGGTETIAEAELAVFETEGSELVIEASQDSKILVLAGEPLNEPIVGYGPFVMNTEQEIRQAFRDYQSGRMGRLSG
jgi:redox-sensitive bicupin YhaK (pirin superfamily)